jgi:hypothetical protein
MNEITMYLHCGRCLAELPNGQSPQDYARVSVGICPGGVQIWCNRHDINVAIIDPTNLVTLEAGTCAHCHH